jgi:ABC-type multidrug transport system fused ATPase/permease subunit
MVQGWTRAFWGQWQKIALSRAFMRDSADILVLDEPTSAMDAQLSLIFSITFAL